jgi:hypothetical protein
MTKLLLFLSLPLILLSCLKDGELNFIERKVVGDWYYSEVIYRDNVNFFNKQDLSVEYEGSFFTFYADKSVTYFDAFAEETFEGQWDLVENYNSDYTTNTLVVSVVSNESDELKQIIFENFSVTNRKMRGNYSTNTGNYTYCLNH